MMKRYVLFFALFFFSGIYDSPAQRPDQILLDTLYIIPLDKVLDDISRKHHVRFDFDRELLHSCEVNYRPIREPLDRFLTFICSENKLRWMMTGDSVIVIISKYESSVGKTISARNEKTYTGPPEKFGITISGVVRDKTTGETLPFANLAVKGTSIGTTTNADGHFTLEDIPTDTSTLCVSYIGYRQEDIYLTPDLPLTKLCIEMQSQSTQLKELEVKSHTSDAPIQANEKISMVRMVPQKLTNLPNLGEKDIFRSFQLMPGISVANESSSNLYVRGGSPDQNLILYDGFTVYQVDHLYGFYSAFNPNAVKDVQLYKGGFEAKFGGRLSSVTEITGKDGSAKGFNAGGDVSLLSFNLFTEIPLGSRFTSLIAFRRSFKGPIYNLIFKQFNTNDAQIKSSGNMGPGGRGPAFTSTVTSYFYDLNAKFTYRPSTRDLISLSFFNGTDHLDNGMNMQAPAGFGGGNSSFSMTNEDITRYGNLGTGIRWSRKYSEAFFGNILVSYSQYYSRRDRSSSGSLFSGQESMDMSSELDEKNDLIDISLKSDNVWNVSAHHLTGFGLFLTKYAISYHYGQNDTAGVLNNQGNGFLGGLYIQDRINPAKSKITLTPGLRASWYSLTGRPYLEPRISLVYNPALHWKVIAETGLFYQFAYRVVREDVMTGSRDFWILSDGSTVPVGSAWHYIAGLSYETRTFLASIEAYYKSLHGVTEYTMRFNPAQRDMNMNENFYSGKGFATGVEFLLQKKSGNFTGWIGYTFGEVMNRIDVYGPEYYPAPQDVRHEVKLIGLYDFRNWSFSATLLYATGRPYTPPDGTYDITLVDGTTQTYIDFGIKNGNRLPAYHRLDLAVNYRLRNRETLREWGNISLSIFNVYNRKNVWYKEFQIIDGEVIETDKLFLGITPNLTLSIKLK